MMARHSGAADRAAPPADPEQFDLAAPPQIDRETLAQLAALDDGDLSTAREICALYFEDARERVERIRQMLAEGDLAETARTAHSLKGASYNLGVTGMGQICAAMEYAATDGDGDRCLRWMDVLEAELERVVPVLEEEIRRLAA
jgi:HPt (histidine-containing phosphotransfer) domain-containing protein